MKIIIPIFTVIVLIGIPFIGVNSAGMEKLFGIYIPYLALLIFIVGFVSKVVNWSRSPVPLRIPTTCGQAKSLPWIKQNKIDNPATLPYVLIRMALEVFAFRSLFRNTKAEKIDGAGLTYGSNKFLWLGAMAFHYAFVVVFIRHYRLFLEPVPSLIKLIEAADGFAQITLPTFYITDALLLAALTYLLLRRIVNPQIRFISLVNDYFPLLLIIGIASTGILMRYFIRVDIVTIKTLVRGLINFSFTVPDGISSLFYIHLFLVSTLAAYFPFSKLMHLGGIFLSPTRNLANNNRERRHVNPWNPDIKIRTYSEYEDDYREKMRGAGLPLEKE